MPLNVPVHKKLNIHIIGAGGTGGYAVTYLARLLAGGNHVIHVYDGDMVEAKNLKRQNFVMSDLDLNKAEAICKRIKTDIPQAPKMVVHGGYITDKDEFLADLLVSLEEDESLIVVMAVDNVATRKLINKVIMEDLVQAKIPTIVFDSGNDNQGGQVMLYGNACFSYEVPFTKSTKGVLPTMIDYFNLNDVEDDNPGLVTNCADNAESEPQAMMCNVRNGEILAHSIARILETHKAPGNLWRSDILTGNTTCSFTGFLEG